MDLNFKCLGKNIGPMIVEILRPFEFGMKNTHSDGKKLMDLWNFLRIEVPKTRS